MVTDEYDYDGEPVEYLLTRYCDGCVFTDTCPDDMVGACRRHSAGDVHIQTSLHIGLVYERSKILHAIRFNGVNLYQAHGKRLSVTGWVMIPVDKQSSCGEIVIRDRLILLCEDQSRYYTDWEPVVDLVYGYLMDSSDMRVTPLEINVSMNFAEGVRGMNVTCRFAGERESDERKA